MPDWRDRVDQLLFEGEEIESSVDVGSDTVVVTTQRVLAFTPNSGGKEFRAIDRPNVTGVDRQSVSEYDLRRYVAMLGIGGALSVVVGLVLDPAALFPRPDLSGARGAGSVVDGVQRALDVFYMLDTILLGLGLLLVVIGLGLLGLQLATRREVIVIDVAGEDDLHLAVPAVDPGPEAGVPAEESEPTVHLLRRALELPESDADAGTGTAAPR